MQKVFEFKAEEVKDLRKPKKTPKPLTDPFVVQTGPSDREAKQAVRRHAALRSAGRRKATIAAKVAQEQRDRLSSRATQRATNSEANHVSNQSSRHLVERESKLACACGKHDTGRQETSDITQQRTCPALQQAIDRTQELLELWSPTLEPIALGQGRVDPFRSMSFETATFETVHLDLNRVPKYIDHYLSFIAPDIASATSRMPRLRGVPVLFRDREMLRPYLWPRIMGNTPLFWAAIFVAASHQSTRYNNKPAESALVWDLRHMAINAINRALAEPGDQEKPHANSVDDDTISAVGILAQWEHVYGDQGIYDTHCKGLTMMIKQRQNQRRDLPEAVWYLVYTAVYDFARWNGQPPYLKPPPLPARFDYDLAPSRAEIKCNGFLRLRKRIYLNLRLGGDISRFLPFTTDLSTDMREPILTLASDLLVWRSTMGKSVQWTTTGSGSAALSIGSIFLWSAEDELLNMKAHGIIHSTAMCMVKYLCVKLSIIPPVAIDLNVLWDEATQLGADIVPDTIWAETLFWAIYTMCAISCNSNDINLRMLWGLMRHLGLQNWEDVRRLLEDFVYLRCADDASKALWHRLQAANTYNGT